MYSTQILTILLWNLCCTLMKDVAVAGLQCKGRSNLLEQYNIACLNEGNDPDITETQSCLVAARQQSSKTCTTDKSCTEINIKIVPNKEFQDSSQDLIWSFSSCYKPTMSISICTDGKAPVGTTTPPTTITELDMNTTSTSAATTSTAEIFTSTTTTTISASTGTLSTTASLTTTSEIITSSSTASPTTTHPTLDGCYEGEVKFTKEVCEAQSVKVKLISSLTSGDVEFAVEVLGCCTEDGCKVADATSQTGSCYYGDDGVVVRVSCSSHCYGYFYRDENGREETKHGCLSDFSQGQSGLEPFGKISECTKSIKEGTCFEVKDKLYCIRCCSGTNCNSWKTYKEFLDTFSTTTKDSRGTAYCLTPMLPLLLILGSILSIQ